MHKNWSKRSEKIQSHLFSDIDQPIFCHCVFPYHRLSKGLKIDQIKEAIVKLYNCKNVPLKEIKNSSKRDGLT